MFPVGGVDAFSQDRRTRVTSQTGLESIDILRYWTRLIELLPLDSRDIHGMRKSDSEATTAPEGVTVCMVKISFSFPHLTLSTSPILLYNLAT